MKVPAGVNLFTWTVPTRGVYPVVGKIIKHGFFAGWGMLGLLWLIRLPTIHVTNWHNINYEFLVATLIGLPMLPSNFLVGMFLHNFVGSAFAFVYVYLFERVLHRVSVQLGILFGLVHAIVIGGLLVALPLVHPAMPGLMDAPGPWCINLGIGGVVSWFSTHLMYGFLMGFQYRRITVDWNGGPTAARNQPQASR